MVTGEAGWNLLAANAAAGLLALVLPMLVIGVVSALSHRLATLDFYGIPALMLLPKLAGILLGVVMLADWLPEGRFVPSTFFDPGSYWNMAATEFLERCADPFAYDLPAATAAALAGEAGLAVRIAAWLALLALAGATVLAMLVSGWIEGLRNIGVAALLTLSGAFITVYIVAFILWAVYSLNFWVFLVLAAAYQYRRHHHAAV
ncbi:MAG TPA: hypothetical protein VD995_16180 [Azospirillum sp.]|nr:hypothetical protein [Azospirillum sp.]